MNEEQYERLMELASAQLKVTETESQWAIYVEGVTDLAYSLKDYDLLNRLDNRLWIMWDTKRKEGMI